MSRLASHAALPLVLAAASLSLGSLAPGLTAAADQAKGAECAAIDDPTARLACFDAAFPRASRASSGQPPAPAAAAAAPPAPAAAAAPAAPAAAAAAAVPAAPAATSGDAGSEARKFGLSSKQRAALEGRPVEPVTATTAAVRSVRHLPSGYLLIGLDNDQVWQQTEYDRSIWLEPGDRVTIRQGSLSSYLLETPGKYSTRVRRVQ